MALCKQAELCVDECHNNVQLREIFLVKIYNKCCFNSVTTESSKDVSIIIVNRNRGFSPIMLYRNSYECYEHRQID